MEVNHKRYNKQLYFYLFFFLLTIATVFIIMINYNNKVFINNLLLLSVLIVVIILALIGSEWFMRLSAEDGLYLGNLRKHIIAFFFFIKNYFIVYLFTIFTRYFTIFMLTLFYYEEETSKLLFNTLFLTNFILSFALYSAYINSKLPHWIRSVQVKIRLSKVKSTSVLEEKLYKKDVIKWIDALSIAFTVLILSNSTYITYAPVENNTGQDLPYSFEVSLLFIALPFYVLTTYHILNSRP